MKAPLGQLAEVSVGLTLRSPEAAQPSLGGNYRFLRISDIDDFGTISTESDNRIMVDDPKLVARHKVRPGDVLLANRGMRSKAGLVLKDEPVIAGNQLYIIRLRDPRVLPGFLMWYLNEPSTQKTLISGSTGAVIQSMPVHVIRELEIPIPPLHRQHLIAAIHELRAHEHALTLQLEDLKSQFISRTLMTAAIKPAS